MAVQQLLPRECGSPSPRGPGLACACCRGCPGRCGGSQDRCSASTLLGDGDLILLVALVLTVLAVSVQSDVEEARLAAEDQELEKI